MQISFTCIFCELSTLHCSCQIPVVLFVQAELPSIQFFLRIDDKVCLQVSTFAQYVATYIAENVGRCIFAMVIIFS